MPSGSPPEKHMIPIRASAAMRRWKFSDPWFCPRAKRSCVIKHFTFYFCRRVSQWWRVFCDCWRGDSVEALTEINVGWRLWSELSGILWMWKKNTVWEENKGKLLSIMPFGDNAVRLCFLLVSTTAALKTGMRYISSSTRVLYICNVFSTSKLLFIFSRTCQLL